MPEGLLFRDALAFDTFVRLEGTGKTDQNALSLLTLVDPAYPLDPVYLLTGSRRGKILVESPELARLCDRVTWKAAKGRIEIQRGAETMVFPEPSEAPTARHLIDLVPLRPCGFDVRPVVHLLLTSSRELAARVVGDSFSLGNDRISLATIDRRGSAVIALRIDSPSAYILQALHEDHAEELAIYYAIRPEVFVRWGFHHPLEAPIQRSTQRPDHLSLIGPQGVERLSGVRWEDIYESVSFLVESAAGEEVLSPSAAGTATFPVSLKLERQSSHIDSELWLLDEGAETHLEAFVNRLDEEDFSAVQLGVFAGAKGERRWVIRAADPSRSCPIPLVSGTGYHRFLEIQNLLLPQGHSLRPLLRRDRYQELFSLKRGELCLVTAGAGGILRISESGFRPLADYVRFVIAEAGAQLEEIAAATIFDLGAYVAAPRLALSQVLQSAPNAPPPGAPADDQESTTKERATKGRKAKTAAAPTEAEPEAKRPVAKVASTDVSGRELELERLLTAADHTCEMWMELAREKVRRGRAIDAFACCEHALWMATAKEETAIRGMMRGLGEEHAQALRTEIDLPALRLLTRAGLGATMDEAYLRQQMTELRSKEGQLPHKRAWLLWRELLLVNRDSREETRVRESIQKAIRERGLSPTEIPAFLRQRIADESLGDTANVGGNSALAHDNVTLAEQLLPRLTFAGMDRMLSAILARSWGRRLMLDVAASQWVDRARQDGPPADPVIQASTEVFIADTLRKTSPTEADRIDAAVSELRRKMNKDDGQFFDSIVASLAARTGSDNPAALLASDNIRRYYPQGGSFDRGPIVEMTRDLLAIASTAANPEKVLPGRARTLMDTIAIGKELVPICKAVDALADVLARFRWTEGIRELGPQFVEMGRTLLATERPGLYGVLLANSIAQGMHQLDLHQESAGSLLTAIRILERISVPLDFIDGAAAVATSLELLPVTERHDGLRRVITALGAQIEERRTHYSMRLTQRPLMRLLDQLVESAASRDKLAGARFRRYLHYQEFVILSRLVRDQPSQTATGGTA